MTPLGMWEFFKGQGSALSAFVIFVAVVSAFAIQVGAITETDSKAQLQDNRSRHEAMRRERIDLKVRGVVCAVERERIGEQHQGQQGIKTCVDRPKT